MDFLCSISPPFFSPEKGKEELPYIIRANHRLSLRKEDSLFLTGLYAPQQPCHIVSKSTHRLLSLIHI